VFDLVSGGHADQEQHRRREQVAPLVPGGEAADRHAQEAGQQHDVGEEGQEQDVGRKPADAGQFQGQNQQADQEQIEHRPGRRRGFAVLGTNGFDRHWFSSDLAVLSANPSAASWFSIRRAFRRPSRLQAALPALIFNA
jgi:hypothetical protein